MTSTPATPRELLTAFQQAMVAFDPDALADLFALDAVYEFPFLAPQRGTSHYHGRDEIRAGFRSIWGGVSPSPRLRFIDIRVHDTADPEVVVAEHEFEASNPVGETFRSGFLLVLTARAGRIVHLRDYADVLRVSRGLGRLPQLFAAMRETAPAYALSEVTPRAPHALDVYRTHAADSIRKYGGRYLVRGADVDVVEGTWPGDATVVLVEFPSADRLREWYGSPEYAEALQVRDEALSRRLLFLDAAPDTE